MLRQRLEHRKILALWGINKAPKMESLVEKYWLRWRDCVAARRYRDWREIQDELADEARFAIENDMETEFWCWNCKHSDCEKHKQTYRR